MTDQIDVAGALGKVREARTWPPALVDRLEALLGGPAETLVRVNPMAFGRAAGVSDDDAIALFLHAAHAGLFTMEWHLLCPLCGTAVESFGSLRRVHKRFTCALCVLSTEATMDEHIQVGFTVSANVRRIAAHDPRDLSAIDALRLRLTPEARIEGMRFADAVAGGMQVSEWLEPGETTRHTVLTGEGVLSVGEFQGHTGKHFPICDGPLVLDVRIGEELVASSEVVGRGRVALSVTNERPDRFAIYAAVYPGREKTPALSFDAYLTGARLLTSTPFRKLFRGETVRAEDGIAVRDVTLLFTDLKGSTALYERIGDIEAFALVHAHFDRLSAVVAAHGGAVVKTIGDAIMAVFSEPASAARAALEMLEQIDRFNGERGRRDVILKIGVHRGPSIAVTLNENLDYFGQAVNVAARVQALADSDEIFVTDDVYQAHGVAEVLGAAESRDAELRGIQRPVRVHRIHRSTSR